MATTSTPAARAADRKRRLAWGAPVVVAALIAGGVAIAEAGPSDARPTLPARTARQLLLSIERHAQDAAYSGQVSEDTALGLPSLPGDSSTASLSWQSFITGTHTARVWVDGLAKQRIALLGQLSEADVVHNGRDLWTYTSDTNTASHTVLPARSAHAAPDADMTPAAATARVLKAIRPSTAVSVDTTQMVAGRPAYTLVIRPRDHRSTVSSIQIAVDSATSVPLRLEVFGAGSTPALRIGFTDITFGTPAASTFRFTVPKGADVTDHPFGTHHDHPWGSPGPVRLRHDGTAYSSTLTITPDRPTLIGSGWTAVAELPYGADGELMSTIVNASSPVGTDGTRLLRTALLNAVIRPDGRIFVGAVRPAYLEHVAAIAH